MNGNLSAFVGASRTSILLTMAVAMLWGCSSKSTTRDVPPPPLGIEVVEPTAGRVYSPKGEVRCTMILASPPGEFIGAMVSVGIWKGENDSITKFGQVAEGASPDGMHELEATLVAPEVPGEYTIKAIAQGRDADKSIKTIESKEVKIVVK